MPRTQTEEHVAEIGSLNKFIKHDLPQDTKDEMRKWIDCRTEVGSKVAQYGPICMYLLLLYSYHIREEPSAKVFKKGKAASTFVQHCFNPDQKSSAHVPQWALDELKRVADVGYPEIVDRDGKRACHMANAIKEISTQWAVNATNLVEMYWEKFLQRVVDADVTGLFGVDPKSYANTGYIIKCIMDPEDESQLLLQSADIAIVEYHRSFFDDFGIADAVLDAQFVAKNPVLTALLFMHWLNRQEWLEHECGCTTRKISVIPMSHGRRSIPMTSFDLFYMVRDLGDIPRYPNGKPVTRDHFNSPRHPYRNQYWRKYFEVDK